MSVRLLGSRGRPLPGGHQQVSVSGLRCCDGMKHRLHHQVGGLEATAAGGCEEAAG